mgnify:CR=1 FL=1
MSYFQEANELYNSKNYINALHMYKKAINSKDNEAASLYNAGVCFIKLKEYENAIIYLKKALLIKKDSKYFFNLGFCHAVMKDNKKALIYFNTAWSLNNKDDECRNAIDIILKTHVSKK